MYFYGFLTAIHEFLVSERMGGGEFRKHWQEKVMASYCTFDLNWQPGPWKQIILLSPQ